ncbi:MAG: T9SS type A sorting domain-containing protein [Saprospiraceae bacterium]
MIPRIKNVTKLGFEFQIDEWNYLNGYHPVETLYYLAMAKGNHSIDGVNFEAGCFTANHNWTTKSFDQAFSGTPVVLTTVASYNDANAVAPRTQNVGSASFQLKLQEEDLSSHGNETIHYIAMNQGAFSHGGANFKAGITSNSVTHNWYTIDFGSSFTDPGFLASFHTYDGGDVCAIRHQNLSSSNVQVKVEEEQWLDAEVGHTSEAMGWLVFSASTTLNLAASSVENLSLEAVKGLEFASLYWTHNEGFRVREYILEKSTDGTHFEQIWSVDSEGGNAKELYEGYDMEPTIGENIYRIQLVYLDGTIGYSEAKSLYYDDLIDFVLFPNPANDFVKVNMETAVGEKDVVLTIYNNLGVLVKEVKIDQVYSKYYQIDLQEMKEGHYIVWMNVPGRKPLAKQLVIGKI